MSKQRSVQDFINWINGNKTSLEFMIQGLVTRKYKAERVRLINFKLFCLKKDKWEEIGMYSGSGLLGWLHANGVRE
jgi:hypothetical protein